MKISSIYLSIHLYIYLFIYMHIFPSIYLYKCTSISLSIYQNMYLSFIISLLLSIFYYLSMYLSINLLSIYTTFEWTLSLFLQTINIPQILIFIFFSKVQGSFSFFLLNLLLYIFVILIFDYFFLSTAFIVELRKILHLKTTTYSKQKVKKSFSD